jgi:hypothetical protein
MRASSGQAGKTFAPKSALVLLFAVFAFAQLSFGKAVGTVKSISGNSVVLTTSAGAEATVTLSDSTRILQTKPGQTDLKTATPIHVSDIKVGDRILAIGPAGEGNATLASTVIVMKQGDIAEKQQQEREEWRNGVGGIVKEVNASAGTIAISNASSVAATGKQILVHVSPTTDIRRYSSDSVKFDDAKPGTIDQIKPGDQIRARGERNADGTAFTAQAIVSGAFRQIAGMVVSTNPGSGSIIVQDLLTKKPVTLKVTADSEMRKLPEFVAQRLAMRLKGAGSAAPGGGAAGEPQHGPGSPNGAEAEGRTEGRNGQSGGPSAGGNGRNRGGSPDFQQMLSRMPAVSISDLKKGDAVILVATEGRENSAPTTITLLAGVEPILSAAPAGAAAATILSPWNLGASPGGDAASE